MVIKKYPVKLTKKVSGKGYVTYLIYIPKEVIRLLELENVEYLVMEVDTKKKTMTLRPL